MNVNNSINLTNKKGNLDTNERQATDRQVEHPTNTKHTADENDESQKTWEQKELEARRPAEDKDEKTKKWLALYVKVQSADAYKGEESRITQNGK